MVVSPLLIRHNRLIARALLRNRARRTPRRCARRRRRSRSREREHVIICGFGRVGQNIARVLERKGFEYLALDVDAYRIRRGARRAIR